MPAFPVQDPTGNMIVDIGGGTTEVAMISLGGVVTSQSVRVGGDELDEAIIAYIKKEYSLALGERTAEAVKIELGSACPLDQELQAEVRGRDLVTGLPKTIVTSTYEIREALEEPVSSIVDAVKVTLDKTPPELAADVMERGIMLAGGGALLKGLAQRLAQETGMPIRIAARPLEAVALGSGQTLEEFDVLGHARVQPRLIILPCAPCHESSEVALRPVGPDAHRGHPDHARRPRCRGLRQRPQRVGRRARPGRRTRSDGSPRRSATPGTASPATTT